MTPVRPLVTLGIVALAIGFFAGGAAASNATTVDECRTISEPGHYELESDLEGQAAEGDACLDVTASDVVIEGDGHTVAGAGGATGVRVAPPDFTTTVENVTVRDLRVRDWGTGVAVRGDASDVELRNVTATDSTRGFVLVEVSDLAVRDLAARENGDGVITKDLARSTFWGLALANNTGAGLRATNDFDDTLVADVRAEGNGGTGIEVGPATNTTIRNATVTDNGEEGFVTLDTGRVRVETLRAVGNGGAGLSLTATVGARFENVTARDNGGNAYTARDSRNVSVAFASLGGVQDVAVGDGNAAVDAADLPPTPNWLTPGGPAIRVAAVSGGSLQASPVTVTLPHTCRSQTPSLWRHDGETWQSVPGSRSVDGRVTATVSEPGVVAPLALTFRGRGDCPPAGAD